MSITVSHPAAIAVLTPCTAVAAECMPRVSHLSFFDELEFVGSDGLRLCRGVIGRGSGAGGDPRWPHRIAG